MGSRDLKAKIRLEGDASGANKAIKSTEKGFGRLGQKVKSFSIAQVAAIGGVVFALRGLVRGIGASIKAAGVQEDAINALDGALQRLGPSAAGVSKALQQQAAALQQITKFGDEEIIQAQALIASFVSEESQIKAATKASLDLAEAKGFSLKSAADLVSKTLGSSTNALTRYGIEVEGAVGSSERLASLTDNVAKAFGGRAAKAAETYSGKVQQLKNAYGDMQEEIGFAITKNQDMIDSIEDMKGNVEDLTPQIAALTESIVLMGTESVNALVGFGKLIGEFIVLADGTGDISKAMDDSAISFAALDSRASELGISVDELKLRLIAATHENRRLNTAAREAASGLNDEAAAADAAAKAQRELDAEIKKATDDFIELGKALGLVTSAELEKEISTIATNLETVRAATGGIGPEFELMEATAAKSIESLELRVEHLNLGLGDMGKEAADAALGFGTLTSALKGAGGAADDTGDSVEDLDESLVSAKTSTTALDSGMRSAEVGIRRAGDQALATARQFDALRKSAGEAAAVAAALAAGGYLTQGGTRIRFPTGGSRLTNTSGRGTGVSSYSLSAFGTGGSYTLDASGNLRPV